LARCKSAWHAFHHARLFSLHPAGLPTISWHRAGTDSDGAAGVYIVLGILYESLVHPVTIISTLPSASVGAMLALMLFKQDLNIISIIGIVLLIGIVKKNAIMMIDSLCRRNARKVRSRSTRFSKPACCAFVPS